MDAQPVSNLARRARGGVLKLVGRLVVLRVITLLGTLVVARLLLPAEYGLFAIAVGLAMLIGPLAELGLGTAIVRSEQEPAERHLDAIWTFQLLAAGGLAVGALLVAGAAEAAELVAAESGWLFAAAAVAILVAHLQSVPGAVLVRRLAFGRLALIEVSGQVVYFVVAIALAAGGAGAWALVVGLLAQNVLGTALLHASWGRRPRLVRDPAAVRAMLPFGIRVQAGNYLNAVRDALPPLLGPLAGGAAAAGQLQLGVRLGRMTGGLDEVAAQAGLPAFSRLAGDQDRASRAIREGFETLALVAALPIAWLVAVAPVLIPMLFGGQWLPAVPVFQAVALASLVAPNAQLLRTLALADGRAGLVLKWSAAALLVLAVALPTGLIVAGLTGGGVALLTYAGVLAIGYTLIVGDLVRVPWLAAVRIWLLAGTGAIAAAIVMATMPDIAGLIVSGLAAAAVYGVLVLLLERGPAVLVARRVAQLLRR